MRVLLPLLLVSTLVAAEGPGGPTIGPGDQAVVDAVDQLRAVVEANELAEQVRHTEVVFLLQVCAMTLAVLWGAFTWRMIILTKNQRSIW